MGFTIRLLPTATLLAVAGALAWVGLGRIAANDWLPYALLSALVLATVLFSGSALTLRRTLPLGPAGLLALAGWAALSLTWSAVPTLARDEALLTLFYAIAFIVPLLTLRAKRDRLGALVVLVLGLGVLAAMTAIKLLAATSPFELYDGGRLDFPVTYVNGDAAFFLVGFWPAVVLAARQAVPAVLRGACFSVAVALLGAGVMAQSKGSALGLAVSAIAFFALCPGRLRALLPTALAAAIVGAAFLPLTAPFRTHSSNASIHHAATVLLLVTVIGLAVGLGYALLETRVRVSDQARQRMGAAVLAALALAALGGIVAFFATVQHPGRYAADKWRAFKHQSTSATGSTHLLELGSNRYDFWRVALIEFAHHPIAGIGSRGFMPAYLQKRRSPETPARAHSLPLEVLAEGGLVGFALLAVGLGVPLFLCARGAIAGRAPPAAAFAGGIYWLAHASVDWLWTIPAVGVVFLVLLGIGTSDANLAPRALDARVRYALAVAAVAVAAFLFAPPWISARLDSRALKAGSSDGDLRWARRLDPLSLGPLYAEFRLSHSPSDRIRIAREAVEKEPRWVGTQYLLGIAYLDAGRKAEARRALRKALRLDPHEARTRAALRRAQGRK